MSTEESLVAKLRTGELYGYYQQVQQLSNFMLQNYADAYLPGESAVNCVIRLLTALRRAYRRASTCHYCEADLTLSVCHAFADVGQTKPVYWVQCSACGARGPISDTQLGAQSAHAAPASQLLPTLINRKEG